MDWTTISSLATAGGTLVLGIATFASVRSANRAVRAAEGSLLAGLRPLLVPSRLQDLPEKISFADQHWLRVEGGHAVAEVSGDVIYLAISLRNVGSGIGVLHGWQFYPQRLLGDVERPEPGDFRRLTRDVYVPAGDCGFWQGAFRDPSTPEFSQARDVIARGPISPSTCSTGTSKAASGRPPASGCCRWGRRRGSWLPAAIGASTARNPAREARDLQGALDAGEDVVNADAVKARRRAPIGKRLHHAVLTTRRSADLAAGRTEQPHRRGADRGGKVEERSVRRDQQVTAGDHRRCGGEVQLATKVHGVGRQVELHRLGGRTVAGVADKNDPGPVTGRQAVGKVCEALRAPGRSRAVGEAAPGRDRHKEPAVAYALPEEELLGGPACLGRGKELRAAGADDQPQGSRQSQPGLGAVPGGGAGDGVAQQVVADPSGAADSPGNARGVHSGADRRQLGAYHGHVQPAAAELTPEAAETQSGGTRPEAGHWQEAVGALQPLCEVGRDGRTGDQQMLLDARGHRGDQRGGL